MIFTTVVCWTNPSIGRFLTCGTDKDAGIAMTKGYVYLFHPPFHFCIGCVRKADKHESYVRLIKVENMFEVYSNLLRRFKTESIGVKSGDYCSVKYHTHERIITGDHDKIKSVFDDVLKQEKGIIKRLQSRIYF
jgi:hypothetical protein